MDVRTLDDAHKCELPLHEGAPHTGQEVGCASLCVVSESSAPLPLNEPSAPVNGPAISGAGKPAPIDVTSSGSSTVRRSSVITGPPSEPQLQLKLSAVPPASRMGLSVPREDQVFVNRDLDLDSIDWLGFDMDYTLAIYQQQALDDLSVHVTVERMIAKGYPSYLRNLQYDSRFPIRGLLVDKRYGNVLKMDRFKVVHKAYHGLSRLPDDEVRRLYHETKVRPHTSRYHWIDTLFSLSEVTSFCAIVDALEKHSVKLDFGKTFQDVRESIDEAHRDGQFHTGVMANLDKYLQKDSDLGKALHKFRCAGKRLFLLTNSPWPYTDALMTHLLGSNDAEYPSWQRYFDVVIVGAQKPGWFREGRPLLERKGQVLENVQGELKQGRVYEGGNLKDFERRMGVLGSKVLYVGDHIYGDILRSKKESNWRTAMIIQEMEAEMSAHTSCTNQFLRVAEIEIARQRLEDELRYQQVLSRGFSKGQNGNATAETRASIDALQGELKRLNREHANVRGQIDAAFHPYWGSLLKEAGERSSFGTQIATYADIYMRRVSSLIHYSPQQHFRSRRDLMPHEQ